MSGIFLLDASARTCKEDFCCCNLIGLYRSRENKGSIRWYTNTKAGKYFSCYLYLYLSGQVVYFHQTDYYCIILSHYLQLQLTVNRKKSASEFLFNQPVACYSFNKELRHRCFLVNFSRKPFLQTTLGLLLLYLFNISIISPNLISHGGFSSQFRH